MEEPESNLFQTRKSYRVEQIVTKWLRRSRDHSHRRRSSGDDTSSSISFSNVPVRLRVEINKDLQLSHHGFDISDHAPLIVTSVTAGGPADGKLLPGDQIVKINAGLVESISCEEAANIFRDSEDSIFLTVLRNSSGPKSSFLTAEKRARLRSNPVKVRFAEEVLVNGHTQGNSLLFLPNVLKVYLENGQTKAFKFENKTTVKDIILTLKEKLSIQCIDHFALALEEQYNISKLYLLHEDELIEQVVRKRESHDYRCLFRVCFVPKDPFILLQEDPVAFEYLYLQSCSDVLQERFATEMKCGIALRLAALHIQERIFTCAHPQKISFKYIEKDWGIENFLSPTLLRNMKGKDIKKAISFHMKRNQSLLEPRQKHMVSAAQARLSYLKILGDLKTYGGKIFNATLLLQDRESYITLLVGAKYGVSQIINNKLNITASLTEFANISRIELTQESEKVSMVKIYLQDIKSITLLLESYNAKDLACLIAGYYKLFVDAGVPIFRWPYLKQMHRISAEEGYESRACSDSEESSEIETSLELLSDIHVLRNGRIKPLQEEEEKEENEEEVADETEKGGENINLSEEKTEDDNTDNSTSEVSDYVKTESKGFKLSYSSDSIDALEEDDLEACSISRPEFLELYIPELNEMASANKDIFSTTASVVPATENCDSGRSSFSSHLQCPDKMDSTPEQCNGDPADHGEGNDLSDFTLDCRLYDSNTMEYYSLCANVTPDSSVERNILSSSGSYCSLRSLPSVVEQTEKGTNTSQQEAGGPILHPPPGFGDSSSEDEFFDAADRLITSEVPAETEMTAAKTALKENYSSDEAIPSHTNESKEYSTCNYSLTKEKKKDNRSDGERQKFSKNLRKRRSFVQTHYTSYVTFPITPESPDGTDHLCCYEKEAFSTAVPQASVMPCLNHCESEQQHLELKSVSQNNLPQMTFSKTISSNLMEMEPDTMETKSLVDSLIAVSPVSAIRYRGDPEGKEQTEMQNDIGHCSYSDSRVISPGTVVTEGHATIQMIEPSLITPKHNGSHSSCFIPECTPDTDNGAVLSAEKNEMTDIIKMSDTVGTEGQREMMANNLPQNNEHREDVNLFSESPYMYLESLPLNKMEAENGGCTKSNDERFEPKHMLLNEPTKSSTGETTKTGNNLIAYKEKRHWTQKVVPAKKEKEKFLGFSSATGLLLNFNGTSGVITRLTMSTLRTKLQKLPSYLSKSCDTIALSGPSDRISTPHAEEQSCSSIKDTSSTGEQTLREAGSSSVYGVNYRLQQTLADDQCITDQFTVNDQATGMDEGESGETFYKFHSLYKTSKVRDLHEEAAAFSQQLENLANCANDLRVPLNEDDGTDGSLGVTNVKDAFLATAGTDSCSCKLMYGNCFSGVDTTVDDENIDSEQTSTSSLPLTTPPSSGSLRSVEINPFKDSLTSTVIEDSEQTTGEDLTLLSLADQIDALHQLKSQVSHRPTGFVLLQEYANELHSVLEQFPGSKGQHLKEQCAVLFSENRSILCTESRKLMTSCQKVIRSEQPSEEMLTAVQVSFCNFIQLTEICFQFTSCMRCKKRHLDVVSNLKDILLTYKEFIQAAEKACGRSYSDLSIKLLARQCTALTAGLFCLTQLFRTVTPL
ncbi:FERM and PDZ domain-containing protein 1 [Protopterus annectens]|uniref:FERM and PDZ domain-containing protein 1 n=1 Tax=Protopterus annectens TaxID=7888 RepID=UPI001CF9956D|nr:FERM and PDZ domain-containing protein 1 [Protopterus annectens]